MQSCVALKVLMGLQSTLSIFILQYNFGDLLTWPYTFFGFGYDHYAIYVGSEPFSGKTNDQDIFELTRNYPFKPLFTHTSLNIFTMHV